MMAETMSASVVFIFERTPRNVRELQDRGSPEYERTPGWGFNKIDVG
jgi:hypothetical protein